MKAILSIIYCVFTRKPVFLLTKTKTGLHTVNTFSGEDLTVSASEKSVAIYVKRA
jgi:hypothetical protein